MTESAELPLEIDCHGVSHLREQGDDFLFLDCREQSEHEAAAIPGTTLLPMSEIQDRAEELEPYRQQRIVVHCHHGGRSLRLTRWLRQQGYPHVQSLAGGIDEWSQTIDPTVPRY